MLVLFEKISDHARELINFEVDWFNLFNFFVNFFGFLHVELECDFKGDDFFLVLIDSRVDFLCLL